MDEKETITEKIMMAEFSSISFNFVKACKDIYTRNMSDNPSDELKLAYISCMMAAFAANIRFLFGKDKEASIIVLKYLIKLIDKE